MCSNTAMDSYHTTDKIQIIFIDAWSAEEEVLSDSWQQFIQLF